MKKIANDLVAEEYDTAPAVLNLDVSEAQVSQMELNIDELQRDVSLFREQRGWVVRFHRKENLLAKIGVQDNDFIREGHFERLKQISDRAELMTRLEAIMNQLQR